MGASSMSITRYAAKRIRDLYRTSERRPTEPSDDDGLDLYTGPQRIEISSDGGATWQRSDLDRVITIAWALTVGLDLRGIDRYTFAAGSTLYRIVPLDENGDDRSE